MKTNWRRIGVFAGIVALVGVIGVASVAAAQGADDGAKWPFFGIGEKMHAAIANALGIGVDEYDAAIDTAQAQVIEEAVADGTLTQEQADQLLERMGEGFGGRGMPFGLGGRGGRMGGRMGGWMGGIDGSPLSLAAEQLNLEEDELMAQLQEGKSIAEIAEAQGVDPQAIADEYVGSVSDHLAEAVAEEGITQGQADEMLSRMQEKAAALLDGSFPLSFGRAPGFEHPQRRPSRSFGRGGWDFGQRGGMRAPSTLSAGSEPL